MPLGAVGSFQIEFVEWLVLLAILVSFLVIGIVGAVWVYGDAERRGMDAGLWLALVLMGTFLGLGLGGLLVIGVYRAERLKHPGGTLPPPGGSEPRARFCGVCGQPLAWIPEYRRWYCSKCGQYR